MTKKEDYKNNPEPSYYSGTKYGYSARKVVEDFELGYNTGVAVSYLLRAERRRATLLNKIYKKLSIICTLNWTSYILKAQQEQEGYHQQEYSHERTNNRTSNLEAGS